jgi:hypothetical protein
MNVHHRKFAFQTEIALAPSFWDVDLTLGNDKSARLLTPHPGLFYISLEYQYMDLKSPACKIPII